jgi:hypothetical protein
MMKWGGITSGFDINFTAETQIRRGGCKGRTVTRRNSKKYRIKTEKIQPTYTW